MSTLPLHTSIVASHAIADWLLSTIDEGLSKLGLGNSQPAREVIYFVIVASLCFALGWLIKKAILAATRKIVQLRNSAISRELLHEHTLTKCSHIIPPLIFMALIPFAFNSGSHFLDIMLKLAGIYTLIAFGVGLNAVLTFAFNRYNERENTRNLPIKGILNIATGIVWIIIAIVGVSILIDKSPATLLAGLGAFAAALLLIFKNSILGFVAGIQMSQNDMLRVGDWIVVPSTIANGIVIDVSLSVVKIRNWDNTIVMVPPYNLVTNPFQNWRGMSDSGMRQITRSYTIDITTVRPIDKTFIEHILGTVPSLKEFVDTLDAKGAVTNCLDGSRPVNGTLETNLGLFRAYMCRYLIDNPLIAKDARILVRSLEPTETGIPLQIWCFTATTDFNAYEAIQSALFEHIAAMMPVFDLAIYAAGTETVTMTQPAVKPAAAITSTAE